MHLAQSFKVDIVPQSYLLLPVHPHSDIMLQRLLFYYIINDKSDSISVNFLWIDGERTHYSNKWNQEKENGSQSQNNLLA